ncbi:DEAD/DEAH box helicase [Streptomyces olivaceus]|uniref:RNA helicase n=2 Tax=Streptomyces TaxID=1883 RepID=A0ABS7VX20_STROV|nr:DEAD/DEAH box helicase [Streptomyces olivaceus]MBZ6093995.1 DEAD/DEAH box helicase [Streptomyces olivaceus]MBZ6115111.1 DEAD/DEAH box helicase [Streptomyces olivaceus]MBZ6150248.1 DEAD/DEAH box helicase [Streptomyces olivaceus]MBZ6296832.1 DEAD/DEAH box helicase [Streptomyces olivaceus]
MTTTFRSLGILPETAEALEAVGIITPFPIQELTLPVALSGTDVIGQAKTGTGKTLGFGLPLLERVTVPADVEAGRAAPESLTDAPQALVVVPTRELCQQVTNDLLTAGKARNVRVLAIYGGRAYEPQVEALKKGVDVIVGTPGRLLDLAGQKKLSLKHVRCLVLDEADEMLDLGFLPDVEKIINMLPARRQTMLFSATMPGAVIGLARRYMSQPTHIRATSPDDEGATVANTKQYIYRAHNMDKPEMVARILQAEGRGLAMVFCRTKRTAADLADQLKQRGFASGAVHGDLGQGAREQALRAFRNGKVDVLVCTDVAARGIDVEGVTHVINYQSPEEEKTYLHRIGRTGRAGAKGTAITLVDWDDIPRWQLINKALQLGFNDPPETYSTSPHLYTDLGIPEGIKGVLPRSERTRAGLDAEELEDLGEPAGRGGRTRGGRGGRDESRSGDRERSSRTTPRRRRRMRGGAPVDAEASAGSAPEAAPGGAEAARDVEQAPRTLRRRRRTRNGEPSRQPAVATTAEAVAASAVAAPEVPEVKDVAEAVDAVQVVDAVDAPAKPRRRRTRKAAEAPVAAEAPAVAAAPVAVETPAAEAPAEKPRRRTRKATAPAAETAVDTAEGAVEPAETKPRRTRKTAAAKAETATDTAERTEGTEEAAKPRRRTRKAAQATEPGIAEAATAEAAEAKPRRTRKAATAKTAADTDAAAEPTEAKPRRTRKTAAAKAETATDTAEPTEGTEEAKPRRRTRKAAQATEPVPDTAAGIPAQVSEEPAAAPRRRTRKAAAAVEAPAEEAKPKARRTRKAATAATQAAEPAES